MKRDWLEIVELSGFVALVLVALGLLGVLVYALIHATGGGCQ